MKNRVAVFLVCLGFFLSFPQGAGAQWVRAGKLKGVSVFALAAAGASIFAGTDRGVFRSTDNGANWSAASVGLPEGSLVMCLTLSGSNVYAGTTGLGVFLSEDNGANWKAVNSGLADLRIMSLVVDGKGLFAATMGGGVFLSTDDGAGWAAVSSGLPAATSINCLFKSGGRLYAGTDYRGLFFSTDKGANWKGIASNINQGNPVSCMVMSGADLFAGTVNGVFSSSDDGSTWINRCSPLESAMFGILPQTSVMCLAAHDPIIFAGTDGAGVYMTRDRGKSWVRAGSGFQYNQIYALAVTEESLFAGTIKGGVWRLPLKKI